MSQPPSSWEPHGGQQDYPQGQSQNPYGSTESFGQQPSYTPPPQYGGYPPAGYDPRYPGGQGGYGQPGYPPQYGTPQYGTPYGPPGGGGPERPGAALASAVLSYIQAGIVLFSSFFVLAVGTASTEFLVLGIVQLISVGLLIFGAVQLTSGSGRTTLLIASGLQLALVVYWLIRINSFDEADLDEGFGVVIPLFYAVMPAVALALALNGMVTRFLAAKRGQAASGTAPWGQ